MRILQFGDLHLERGNLHLSVPPLHEIVRIAESEHPDLAIFTGDAVTRRGSFVPEAAREFRRACERIAAACRLGLIAIAGNHDITFDGKACFLQGALEGTSDALSQSGKIRIVSGAPQIIDFSEDQDLGCHAELVVLAIPTPDRYRLNSNLQEGESPESVVNTAIRGLMAQAGGVAMENLNAGHLVVAYHGALNGAQMDNEQLIRAGIDIPIDPALFHNSDLVLLGHLHKPQILQVGDGPSMVYQGASCPLTWGERKIEPRVYIHDLADDDLHAMTEFPLPVVAQMIERECVIPANAVECSVSECLRMSLAAPEAPPLGSRVRLKVTAPRAFLDVMGADAGEILANTLGLLECKIIAEATDDRVAIGADLERGVSIVEALRFWLTGNETDEQLRDQVLTLAQEIELAVVDEDLDAKFDLEVLSLRVKNWCQYDEAEVDFESLGGVIMVRGENTAGKSNLLRAIPFAAYGSQRSGDNLQDLIRHGEKTAEVELLIRCRGEVHRIKRVLKRGAGRSASSVLFFDRLDGPLDDDAWVAAVEGTAAETQAKIAQMIGPLDLFLAAAYADQNSIDSLLELRPAEMKDLLATVLHRDFEGRVAMVRTRARDAKVARDRAGVVSEEAAGEAERLKDVPNLLGATQEAREIAAKRLRDQPNEDDLRRAVDTEREYCAEIEAEIKATGVTGVLDMIDATVEPNLRTAQDRHAAAVTELQALQNDDLEQQRIEQAVREVARLEESARSVESTRARLGEVRAETERASAEAARGVEAQEARAQVVVAAARRDELWRKKEHATGELDHFTERANCAQAEADRASSQYLADSKTAQETHRDVSSRLGIAAAELAGLEADLLRHNEDTALLGRVPCQGRDWDDPQLHEAMLVDMGTCPLLKKAKGAEASIPGLEQKIDDARAKCAELQKLEDASDEVLSALDDESTRVTGLLQAARALATIVTDTTAEIRKIDSELVQVTREAEKLGHLDELIAAGLAAAGRLPVLREVSDQLAGEIAAAADGGLDAARLELDAARKYLAARQARRQELDQTALRASRMVAALEARQRLTEPRARHRAAQEAFRQAIETGNLLAGDLGRLDRELAGLQVKAARLAEVQGKIAATAEELAALDRQLMILATYERALGRDGVPFVLLEQHAIPEIRARVNHYLAPTQYRVEIETERNSVTAGLKPGVYVSFTDPRGRHPLSAASGEQRVSIGSALRQAVADLHASATGTVIRLSVQDEGFGAFDAGRLKGAFETIRRIAERRQTFVFISHVEGMDSIADHLIEVHAGENGGGSTIVVDGERGAA